MSMKTTDQKSVKPTEEKKSVELTFDELASVSGGPNLTMIPILGVVPDPGRPPGRR